MKLIDILITMLGSKYEWPVGAQYAVQNVNSNKICFYNEEAYMYYIPSTHMWHGYKEDPAASYSTYYATYQPLYTRECAGMVADDHDSAVVTFDQFCQALAERDRGNNTGKPLTLVSGKEYLVRHKNSNSWFPFTFSVAIDSSLFGWVGKNQKPKGFLAEEIEVRDPKDDAQYQLDALCDTLAKGGFVLDEFYGKQIADAIRGGTLKLTIKGK